MPRGLIHPVPDPITDSQACPRNRKIPEKKSVALRTSCPEIQEFLRRIGARCLERKKGCVAGIYLEGGWHVTPGFEGSNERCFGEIE
jgi:hypothetical protein